MVAKKVETWRRKKCQSSVTSLLPSVTWRDPSCRTVQAHTRRGVKESVTCFVFEGNVLGLKSEEWVTALCQQDQELGNSHDVSDRLGVSHTMKENRMRMSQGDATEKLSNIIHALKMSKTWFLIQGVGYLTKSFKPSLIRNLFCLLSVYYCQLCVIQRNKPAGETITMTLRQIGSFFNRTKFNTSWSL